MNNVFFQYQNIITIAPFILGGLAFLLIITNTARHQKILFITIVTLSVCVSMFSYGYLIEAVTIQVIEAVVVVAYAIIREILLDR
jgi:CHASE2 domain-containing sensor protein